MANDSNRFQAIIAHAKEYGFVFPSSEIYDGLQAVYDYGQWGSELKRNIKDYWWDSMTRMYENIVGIDAAIFMHPTTWKASGHVDNFNDPMINNKDSKKRYRVDHLIESFAEEQRSAGNEQKAIEVLGEAMKKAVDNKKVRHQLLDRLSIGLPQYAPPAATFEPLSLEEPVPEPAKEEKRSTEPKLPIISPLPDYVGDAFTAEQIEKLKAGDSLFHLNHGKGKVDFVKNMGKDRMASIKFDSGTKLLVLIASDFFRKIEK